jgi:hypothetical protein
MMKEFDGDDDDDGEDGDEWNDVDYDDGDDLFACFLFNLGFMLQKV